MLVLFASSTKSEVWFHTSNKECNTQYALWNYPFDTLKKSMYNTVCYVAGCNTVLPVRHVGDKHERYMWYCRLGMPRHIAGYNCQYLYLLNAYLIVRAAQKLVFKLLRHRLCSFLYHQTLYSSILPALEISRRSSAVGGLKTRIKTYPWTPTETLTILRVHGTLCIQTTLGSRSSSRRRQTTVVTFVSTVQVQTKAQHLQRASIFSLQQGCQNRQHHARKLVLPLECLRCHKERRLARSLSKPFPPSEQLWHGLKDAKTSSTFSYTLNTSNQ